MTRTTFYTIAKMTENLLEVEGVHSKIRAEIQLQLFILGFFLFLFYSLWQKKSKLDKFTKIPREVKSDDILQYY